MLRSLSTLSTDDSNVLPQTKSWTRLLTREIISQVDLEKELKEKSDVIKRLTSKLDKQKQEISILTEVTVLIILIITS
jgi:CII-binding regulator of phage lambda lysogenization HflD